MLKLIVNADDFGLTEGCTKGIIKAMKEGIVRDTTIMINMNDYKDTIRIAKENGINEIGLHLNLTCGRPVLPREEVPSLVDNQGNFYHRSSMLLPVMNIEEVEKEFIAQMERFKETGIKCTHIDSHHHIHRFLEVLPVAEKISKQLNVPIRHINNEVKEDIIQNGIRTSDYFVAEFYDTNVDNDFLKQILNKYSNGILEIMCHPALVDNALMKKSSYNKKREEELKILTSNNILEFIKDREIKLINYREI